VWQRGTSFNSQGSLGSAAYTADRYQFYRGGGITGGTLSRQLTADTTNLPNIQYCARIQRDSGNTSLATLYLLQTLESVNSIPFAGKTVTVSFYARAGANYSNVSSQLNFALNSGTGTDQNVLSGFTGSANVVTINFTLTTTWQRFTVTGTVSSTATQLGFYPNFTPVGTAGAADYVDVTGFQIDIGSVALPFRTNGATIQGELAACQRYYIRTLASVTDANHALGFGNSSTQTYFQATLGEMRVTPTVLDYANLCASDGASNTAITSLSINAANSTARTAFLIGGHASGITQYRPYLLRNNNNTGGYIGFGAEL
jgi:hypothetical protein